MLRKSLPAIAGMILMLILGACGKKEEGTQKESKGTPAAAAKAAVVPGEMVLIPAGEFILGTDDKESTAYPQQKISLPAFWIDKYEVTNSEFLDFSIKSGYPGEGAKEGKDWRTFFTPATPDKALIPVVFITWNDAVAYCKSVGKRLPTEEEWEKAARGTDGRRYPWGNDWVATRSNTYEAGLGRPAPIGQFADDVSPYGVHDMLGNVQEWTSNWFTTYKGNPKKNPNSGQRFRVLRGLGTHYYGLRNGLWTRDAYLPGSLYDFGCRCAKDATPEEAAKAAQSK